MPVIIDGYNLLRAIQHSGEEYENIDEVALCRIISAFLKQKRDHGHIVFDGTGPPDKTNLGGIERLEVYFAGPHSDADTIIEEKIEDSSAPKSLTIVSSDRRIRAAAAARKATSIMSDYFWQMLIHQFENQKLPVPEPKEKRRGITETETEQWLDYFGIE